MNLIFENSGLFLSLTAIACFGLIYLWIKTKKTKYIITSFAIMFSLLGSSIYYISENDVLKFSTNEKYTKEIMAQDLITIRDSKDNIKYPVFREVINITINEDFSIKDYRTLVSLNNNNVFKQSLQMDKQELEDLNTLMQLTNITIEE